MRHELYLNTHFSRTILLAYFLIRCSKSLILKEIALEPSILEETNKQHVGGNVLKVVPEINLQLNDRFDVLILINF